MADELPFNSLGQILSTGGEIALGLAIKYGWQAESINALFAKRFDPMTPADKARLNDLANAAIQGAAMANLANPEDTIDLGLIPVNPHLFGDNPEGRRYKAIGVVEFEDGSHPWQIRFDLPDVPTLEELFDKFRAEARRRARGCEPDLRDVPDDQFPESNVSILLQERRF